jgi:hypothetical protein
MMLARLLLASSLVAAAQASTRDNLDNVSSKLMVHVSLSLREKSRKKESRRSFRDPRKNECAVPECLSRVMAFVDEILNAWEMGGWCKRLQDGKS